jgi:alpha-D-xyloside xylohydrolase
MKFTDGEHLLRKGVGLSYPYEVRDLDIDERSITIYAPPHHVENRFYTIDCMLFTIRVFTPLPDVIGVQIRHFQGEYDKGPGFTINSREDFPVVINNLTDGAYLCSGNLKIKIQTENGFSLDFYQENQNEQGDRNVHHITGSGFENIGYVTSIADVTHTGTDAYMREQLSLGVGECIYGLGERFTPFVKNGQSVDIWNADGGTGSEQAYKNIPLYISNRGYGVFVNHPGQVSFEIGTERVAKVQFSVPGECLEYYIINGPSPKQVLKNYTALTGRPALPPAWSFGLWLTTSFTTKYDEQTVNHFVDGMAERDLPLAVFHFDCFWMKEFEWCNFEWDDRLFPEPERMLARLKEKGLKICVWINPYIAQRSKRFEEGKAGGYLLKKPNGNVWQWDLWQAGMALVDFTNPKAREWYGGFLRKLVDMGVDCFKTDFGERIPVDVVYSDGSDPVKMHNYYTYLYNKLVFEVLEEKLGKGQATVFARSATVGTQKFPVHWGGDSSASYESMAESLRGGLSLSMSGFGFWSHDISGFDALATPDIYKRWLAFGMLSSHSRLHGNSAYKVPWLYDEESVSVLRFFTKLKCRLMPYLFGAACEAAQKGIPVMRPMILEFPDDPACDYLDRQYMLGSSLLVAPVFSPAGTVSYYLPAGQWTNFFTGETLSGGCWRNEKHDYHSIPLLVRSNTILAVGREEQRPDYDFADGVVLQVFNLEDGRNTETMVFDTQGKTELSISISRNDYIITIETQSKDKPWSLLFRGMDTPQSVRGGSCRLEASGLLVQPDQRAEKLALELKSPSK